MTSTSSRAGRRLAGVIDTAGYTRAAVEHLNRLDPQPDAVLATGDLVDGGRPVDYEHLRELVAPLRAPLWLLPGNHDDRSALRAAFPDRAELGGGGAGAASSSTARCASSASTRHAPGEARRPARRRPAGVARRHAGGGAGDADDRGPAPSAVRDRASGTWTRWASTPTAPPALGAVVDRHPQVERVQCGHLHRSILRRWHGTIAATAPSVAHAVALDLRDDAVPAWNREPPGFLLHRWTPDDRAGDAPPADRRLPVDAYD